MEIGSGPAIARLSSPLLPAMPWMALPVDAVAATALSSAIVRIVAAMSKRHRSTAAYSESCIAGLQSRKATVRDGVLRANGAALLLILLLGLGLLLLLLLLVLLLQREGWMRKGLRKCAAKAGTHTHTVCVLADSHTEYALSP